MPVAMRCKAFCQRLFSPLFVFPVSYIHSAILRGCLVFGLLILAVGSETAKAATVRGLYSQEVPVAGQGYQERADAMSQALANVLVKVAGQRVVLANPVVQAALSKPETYVSKFGFRSDDASPHRQQYFQAAFDEQGVNRLLRSAGVAIWGQSRPATLVWLAVEDAGRRSIINASAALPAVFADSFQARGLPVLFPLMDFEDAAAISAVDVWGGFTGKLQQASRRYGSESVLSGRLLQDNERFYGRLTLIFRGVSQSVAVNGLDGVGVTQLAADMVGSTLSGHYAIDASDASGKTLLVVENVVSLEDYAALNKYLEGMTAVRDVAVHKVKGSTVELELVIDGSERQLADALALGRHVQRIAVDGRAELPGGLGAPPATMVYRWVSRKGY